MSWAANLNSFSYILKHPLNQGQRLKALGRWLRWQIGSRLVSAPVLVPWVDKTVLVAKHGETGVTQNIYCGLNEFSEMGFLLHFLGKEDCFIDIGANSGVYSVLAAGCCGARGIAVEPIPSTFLRLTRQLRVNNLSDMVSARNVGVAEKIGTLYFSTERDTMNRIVDSDWKGPKSLLPVTTVDELTAEIPALIKIDVEGHDTAVLQGSKKILAAEGLQAVIVEISQSSVPILAEGGFVPCHYDPFQRRLTKLEWPQATSSANVIAVRDLSAVRVRLAATTVRNFHGKQF